MKRFTILMALVLFTFSTYAQTITGCPWVKWHDEPDIPFVTGYAENPYDNPVATVCQAANEIHPELIDNATAFDGLWSILGDSMTMTKLVSNGVAGDLFDLGEEVPTFGAAWKAVHDGSNLYVMLKYYDINDQADAESKYFQVMAQPTSHVRHEPSFIAASDSAAENIIAYQNMSYARVVELGGGKASFKNGQVSSYEAAKGKHLNSHWGYYDANWGNNEHGLEALVSANHFWDETEGIIRAIMIVSFDGALGYPADMNDLSGDYLAVQVTDTIAFDVKSSACIGGSDADNKIGYHWSADKNNGYASNYYSGYVILSDEVIGDTPSAIENRFGSEQKVFLYNDMLNIRGIEIADVKVYSIAGALVKSAQNVSGQLDMSDVSDGIYVVMIEGNPSGFKVVKN